jgi:hypothetical protein
LFDAARERMDIVFLKLNRGLAGRLRRSDREKLLLVRGAAWRGCAASGALATGNGDEQCRSARRAAECPRRCPCALLMRGATSC